MVFFTSIDNSVFRFFSTYLGVVIIGFFALGIHFISYRKSVNKFTWFILGYLVFASCYDMMGIELSYSKIKEIVVFNKLNQGVFIAIVSFTLWKRAYKDNEAIVFNTFLLLVTVLIIINVTMIFRYLFDYSLIDNHASLNNNRLSLEMLTLVSVLLTMQLRQPIRKRVLVAALFLVVTMLAVFYSSRFVILGAMLIIGSIFYGEFAKNYTLHYLEKLILLAAFSVAVFGMFDAHYNWSRTAIVNSFPAVSQPGTQFENKVRKNIDLKKGGTDVHLIIAGLLGKDITEDGTADLDLNTLSVISRLSNGIQSLNSFANFPFGQGSNIANKRRAFGHSNHSVFLRSLEAYGVFFLAFAFILYFRIAPSKNLAVWVPLILVGIFTSNVIWCTLLPFIVQEQNSKLRKDKGL